MPIDNIRPIRGPQFLFALLLSSGVHAMAAEPTLASCASLSDNAQRLACYDNLAATAAPPAESVRRDTVPTAPVAAAVAEAGISPVSAAAPVSSYGLDQKWELTPATRRGTFVFRPHYDNYLLLANYSRAVNSRPFQPLQTNTQEPLNFDHVEAKFQLSFKLKAMENLFNRGSDLWFGYTQQSYWQAYNHGASSFFRETDYQPELMLVTPIDFSALGWRARFVNLGIVHQSNGRGKPLSRSWNRAYAQIGMERGDFTLTGRAWKRIEAHTEDDNPDILRYMGHGDLVGTYHWNGQEFSALARRNLGSAKGALQLDWRFPLTGNVKGYVQAFSGYGQSLIDYNFKQQSIGFGILIGE